MKYKETLNVIENKVFSYKTHVATIEDKNLIQLGKWTRTTQKHINHVARIKNLKLILKIKS